MASTSTFPGSIDPPLRPLVPAVTPETAEDFLQLLADAVYKVEAELGTNPSGSSDTVTARLAALADALGEAGGKTPAVIQVALSDATSVLSAGSAAAHLRSPVNMSAFTVRASLLTASSSGPVTVDIRRNGTSIFSGTSYLTVNQDSTTSIGSTAYVGAAGYISDDDELTFDIIAPGTGAVALVVTIIETVS